MSGQPESQAWELDDGRLKWVLADVSLARCRELVGPIVAAMRDLTLDRTGAAGFLATLAHESGQFRWLTELWGPTDAQACYERPRPGGVPAPLVKTAPFPLWQRLGNTEPGDGERFKGRGPIQVTGRANYTAAGTALGLDLVNYPEQVATLEVGLRCAAWFWRTHGLYVNGLGLKGITQVVNGGLNGWDDRLKYYNRALEALKATT